LIENPILLVFLKLEIQNLMESKFGKAFHDPRGASLMSHVICSNQSLFILNPNFRNMGKRWGCMWLGVVAPIDTALLAMVFISNSSHTISIEKDDILIYAQTSQLCY